MNNVNVQRLEPYKPPFSVWKLVESIVPVKELPIVKSYVGESLIDYCTDLRNELETMLDIWKEMGDRIEPPIITKNSINNILPDPPKLKAMLTKEIHILVKEIQEKDGRSHENSYNNNNKDKKVIQYVLSQNTESFDQERPKTPLRKSNSDFSASSPVKLRHIQRNINATSIEVVSDLLKDSLNKECKQIEADIEFLQKCVEEDHEVLSSRPSSPIPEPSVAQLRQVCRSLEIQAKSQDAAPAVSSSFKLPTPPSPNRVQLKAIPEKISSAGLHSNKSNFDELLSSGVSECWIEPYWTKCMSDSPPPSTGDSGVSSRPGTCELSSLRDRRKHVMAQLDNDANARSSQDLASTSDNGYATGSSLDLLHHETSDRESNRVRLLQGEKGLATSASPATSISPHPPVKDSVLKFSRRNISNRKFSRKLVKTS